MTEKTEHLPPCASQGSGSNPAATPGLGSITSANQPQAVPSEKQIEAIAMRVLGRFGHDELTFARALFAGVPVSDAASGAEQQLRKLVDGEVGRHTLWTLSKGQGTDTEDGRNWLEAKSAVDATKANAQ
jgi:hypothetical protein